MNNAFNEYLKNCSKAMSEANGIKKTNKKIYYVDTSKKSKEECQKALSNAIMKYMVEEVPTDKKYEACHSGFSTVAPLHTPYTQYTLDDDVKSLRKYIANSGFVLSDKDRASLIDKWGPLLKGDIGR